MGRTNDATVLTLVGREGDSIAPIRTGAAAVLQHHGLRAHREASCRPPMAPSSARDGKPTSGVSAHAVSHSFDSETSSPHVEAIGWEMQWPSN